MKNWKLFLLLPFCLFSCAKDKKTITRIEDYKHFLSYNRTASTDISKEDLKFWNDRSSKNSRDEASLAKLAAIHADLFRSTGLVSHIVASDSLYLEILKNYPDGNVEIFQSLSSNAIAQHQFQKAWTYADKALALGDKKATSLLLLVDASLELGDDATAARILKDFKNKNSFAYLIRKAKLDDHNGKLDSAIRCMEKAYDRIKGNKTLAQWTLTNLGDMYGHAGRINDSYAQYIKVLNINPADDYALKGIAWIALSHDYKGNEAAAIINVLKSRKRMPEAHLMLAEIAALKKDERERLSQLREFKRAVSQPGYKKLYNKYLSILEAEEFQNPEAAIAIAKEEIDNRPTPQSYDLLAWGYYHQKEYAAALDIASRKVADRTFEPETLYHLGMIYSANGDKAKANEYLSQAAESKFELGPQISNKIENALKAL